MKGVFPVGVVMLWLHFSSDQEGGTIIVMWEKYARPDRAECRMGEPAVNRDCKI